MGLAIEVGLYAYLIEHDSEGVEYLENSLSRLNEVLKENGLDEHIEPKKLAGMSNRSRLSGFPYPFLHYLRRYYAHLMVDPDRTPTEVGENENPADDSVTFEMSSMFSSHLLCHSDTGGFYLPLEFKEIIFDDEKKRIEGGMLGSSFELRNELIQIAPKLDIKVDGYDLSDEEAEKVNTRGESGKKYFREYCVWITLFEAARLSIENKTAICFC